jgi:hypothetical protein
MLIPSIIIIDPAIMLIQNDTPPIKLKVVARMMLKIIKTALNPRIKLIVPAISRGLYALSVCPAGSAPDFDNGVPPMTHK